MPAHVRRAQGLHEAAGLDLQRLLRHVQRPKLLGQRRCGADAVLLDFLQLAIDFGERVLERLHQILDGFLPAVEVHSGRLLELGQRGLGQIEERLVVLSKRIGGERRERFAQLLFRISEEGQLFGGSPPLGGQFGLEARAGRGELGCELRADDGDLAIRLCPHDEPDADGEQQTKRDQAGDDEGHDTKFRRRR